MLKSSEWQIRLVGALCLVLGVCNVVVSAPECWKCCWMATTYGFIPGNYEPAVDCRKYVPANGEDGFADTASCVTADIGKKKVSGETVNWYMCPDDTCTLYCDPSQDCHGDPNDTTYWDQPASASSMDCDPPTEKQKYTCDGVAPPCANPGGGT